MQEVQSTASQLPESIDRLLKRFQRLSDPKQRYEQLILYGQKLAAFPESAKLPENKVPGCVSQVYVTASLDQNGKVVYQGESDALISKGFVGFLATALNGLSTEAIAELNPDFIKDTGLAVSLTPSRANGFFNVFKTMQQKAIQLG
ncbi:Fe-S metabolism associated SufE [Thalassoporum mexicanum PCC 7367]|uniref:SufE family protein n=1 Tax=Thalassoporum mexicanum TaxID=3457544 RepID=UPI00029F9175|nr:SufE family protein [Pseudanabaena sp. PCC 7367]AFY69967.1 Fe-S metabolism associated SufE [Pseudanabaena sp. PCC 7367]